MTGLLRRPVLLALLGGGAAGLVLGLSTAPPLGFLDLHRAGTLAARGEGALLYDARARAEGRAYGDPARLPERAFRYPPAAAALAAPLGLAPPGPAWAIGAAALGALAAAGLAASAVLAAGRLPAGAPRWLPWAAVAAFVPSLAAAVAEGLPVAGVFGLAVLGLLLLDRGREKGGGALLGAAAAIKVFPLLLVLWTGWKRRGAALLAGAGAAAALFLALPAVVLGPGKTWEHLGTWSARGADALVTEYDEDPAWSSTAGAQVFEGQAIQAVLTRWVTRAPYARVRELPGALQDGRAHWIHGGRRWDPGTVRLLVGLLTFAVLASAVVATAPPPPGRTEDADARGALEAGLVLALLFVLWPEARWSHLPFLAPAAAAVAVRLPAPRPGAGRWAAVAALSAALLLVLAAADRVSGRALADAVLARGGGLLAGLLLLGASAAILIRDRGAGPPPAAAP